MLIDSPLSETEIELLLESTFTFPPVPAEIIPSVSFSAAFLAMYLLTKYPPTPNTTSATTTIMITVAVLLFLAGAGAGADAGAAAGAGVCSSDINPPKIMNYEIIIAQK
jgi:hypothetical protein